MPLHASLKLSQRYSPVQAVNRLRMANGRLAQQSTWLGKLETVIEGQGVMPVGLQMLDYSQSIVIKCQAEQVVTSTGNVITVATARRDDYGVEGKALVNDRWQKTLVSMTGDVATLTTVTDATAYQAIYWPELVCFCDPPEQPRNLRTSDYSWTFKGEEI